MPRRKLHKLIWKLALLTASLGFVLTGILFLWASTLEIPDFASFEERKIVQSTKIYDRTGKILLNNVESGIRRKIVKYSEISRQVKNATVAIEDAEFYEHRGIKPTAIIRATLVNLSQGGLVQGGSTISQQVVKRSLLTGEKTLTRKIKEAILAIKLEQVLSKEEILAIYLNEAPYGGNIYGVEEAALGYFGQAAAELSVGQAAYLAAMLKAPTYYSPFGQHTKELSERKNFIIGRMAELGFISPVEADQAQKEVVTFLPRDDQNIKAPHFIFYVREQLEERFGQETLETGGFKVITTLDWQLQKKAEEIIKTFAPELEKNFRASNAGLIALDPRTGEILAMVGSRDYFEDNPYSKFNVTLAHRQPGSSIKPIVYAAAFNKGYTPETVVLDLPTQFATACSPEGKLLYPNLPPETCYMPENYDRVFRGPVTLRMALAQSINVPSVKVLYLAGLDNALKTAADLGIKSLNNPDRYGLTLVLGGGEVSLLELTSAYGVFAADGYLWEPYSITSIEDSLGQVIEGQKPEAVLALNTNISRLISNILSDNEARTPAFGPSSPLYFPGREVAAKTGTTNDYRDAWVIGYTPSIVIGAWVGNNDNSPMEKQVAGFIVAPMWHGVFAEALKNLEPETFPQPEASPENLKPILRGVWQGGEVYLVDKISGKLATQYTPTETREERVIRSVHSILYWLDRDDPRGQAPENPEDDSQFKLWETPIRAWAQSQGLTDQTTEIIPQETDDLHRPEYLPQLSITSPMETTVYDGNQRVMVSIQSQSHFPVVEATFYLNGYLLGSSRLAPFNFSFIPTEVVELKSDNTLSVEVFDSVRNRARATRNFEVSI